MPHPSRSVRAMVLAVQVFEDIDLDLAPEALVLPGGLAVPWPLVDALVGEAEPTDVAERARVAGWLRLVLSAARPLELVLEDVRPVGLPRDHVRHPGPDWVQEAVLGGALHLGTGLLLGDEVVPVPRTVWQAVGVDPSGLWPRCREVLEAMGALAARRWELSVDRTLRPMGDCDVVTLLGSAALRGALAGTDGGMRAAVVPMRTRGWTRLSRLDPAFGPAAAMATAPAERGFLRPLLVTADEVVLAGDGGRTEITLRDPVSDRWDAGALRS